MKSGGQRIRRAAGCLRHEDLDGAGGKVLGVRGRGEQQGAERKGEAGGQAVH